MRPNEYKAGLGVLGHATLSAPMMLELLALNVAVDEAWGPGGCFKSRYRAPLQCVTGGGLTGHELRELPKSTHCTQDLSHPKEVS